MTDVVEYGGYQGAVRYEAGRLYIRILHIEDSISATCSNAEQVEAEFRALVEDYLETCEAVGKKPSRPFKGSFNVRIEPELHRKAAMVAASSGNTLNAWVACAISEKLNPTLEPSTTVNLVLYAQAVAQAASQPRYTSAHLRDVGIPQVALSEQEWAQIQAAMLATVELKAKH